MALLLSNLSESEQLAVRALQLWLDSMSDMLYLANRQLEPEEAALVNAPEWVIACGRKLDTTLFAAVNETLCEAVFTPYRAGYALGLIRWFSEFAEKPQPVRPSKRNRHSPRAKRMMGKLVTDFRIRHGLLLPADFGRSKFIPPEARKFVSRAEKLGGRDASEYHRGLADGILGIGVGTPRDRSTDASDVHLLMITFWRFVERMDTVKEFHDWLTRTLGPNRAGSMERAKNICVELGKKFKGRGRPKKNRPPLLLR